MHTEAGGTNVPAFLTKLWKLVADVDYDDLISWSTNGKSFIIRDQTRFSKELLPLYFKHNNMASFIRQLNMYGFRKITHIENSGLRPDTDEIEFYHSCFIKEQENLLEFIKRKVRNENSLPMASSTKAQAAAPEEKIKKEEVKSILLDVKGIKGKQESIDSFLVNLRRENEALWREVALLRQKHQKQQQIVEKLIQFFLTLVHNRGIGMKRNFPLMIDAQNNGLIASGVGDVGVSGVAGASGAGAKAARAQPPIRMNMVADAITGPEIHEVTDVQVLDEELPLQQPLLSVASSVASNGGSNVESNSGSNGSHGVGIDECSKSPFSFGEQDPLDESAMQANALDCLEQQIAGRLTDGLCVESADPAATAALVGELALGDGLEQLPTQSPVGLEQPLEDRRSLVDDRALSTQENALDAGGDYNSECLSAQPNQMNQLMNRADPLQLQLQLPRSNASALVPTSSSVLNTPTYTLENIDDHIEGIDTELNWLQEQLSLGGLNIDTGTLLGLFSPEDEQAAMGQPFNYTPKALTTTTACNDPLAPSTSGATSLAAAEPTEPLSSQTLFETGDFHLSSLVDQVDDQLRPHQLLTDGKPDLDRQFEELSQSGLFDAGQLLNSESDINSLLERKSAEPGSDQKRRKIA